MNVRCTSRDVGQGEVGRVTRRVLCTWHLVGLAVNKTMSITCQEMEYLV